MKKISDYKSPVIFKLFVFYILRKHDMSIFVLASMVGRWGGQFTKNLVNCPPFPLTFLKFNNFDIYSWTGGGLSNMTKDFDKMISDGNVYCANPPIKSYLACSLLLRAFQKLLKEIHFLVRSPSNIHLGRKTLWSFVLPICYDCYILLI